jgi:vacuolar-type H+-ATPase subunit H
MDNSGQNQSNHPSLLAEVAKYERELLAKVKQAEAGAKRTVDSALQQANKIHADGEKALNEEIDSMRRASEEKRNAERDRIVREAEQKLEAQRAQAESHVEAAAKEVVQLVLPGGAA